MSDFFDDPTLHGNEVIDDAIHLFRQDPTPEGLAAVFMAIRKRMQEDGHLVFPVDVSENDEGQQAFLMKTVDLSDGRQAVAAFTSREEWAKAPPAGAISYFIDAMLSSISSSEALAGVVLNPWGESLFLDRADLALILNPDVERFI